MRFTRRTWRARRRQLAVPVGQRRDTHITSAQSPQGIGIDAQMPNSMPRREDDSTTRAGSRDVHDRPGSGSDTARRQFYF